MKRRTILAAGLAGIASHLPKGPAVPLEPTNPDFVALWTRVEALAHATPSVRAGGPVAGAPMQLVRMLTEHANLAALQAVDRRDADAALRRLARAAAGVSTRPLRVLTVGDSITAGSGSVDGTGYRGWLTDQLDRADVTVTEVPAHGGGLMVDTVQPLVTTALAGGPAPDVALVAIGTNDSAWGNVAAYQGRLAALVDEILAAGPDVKVACARITISATWADPVRTDPGIPARQQQINAAVSAVVAARPGRTAVAGMDTIPSSWLSDGGWHPGDAGYLRMARIWTDAIPPSWLPQPS